MSWAHFYDICERQKTYSTYSFSRMRCINVFFVTNACINIFISCVGVEWRRINEVVSKSAMVVVFDNFGGCYANKKYNNNLPSKN